VTTKFIAIFFLYFILIRSSNAQLKFIIEDFEGLSDGTKDLKKNGVFSFGSLNAFITQNQNSYNYLDYVGKRCITLKKEQNRDFAGWGKGIGLNVELDPTQDYLNFYVRQPIENAPSTIKIQLQEDDNDSKVFEEKSDDVWIYTQVIKSSSAIDTWQLISIPLSKFKDDNIGGDGVFNCTYKKGKLLCFIISFVNDNNFKKNQIISFDFISFSLGALPTDLNLLKKPEDQCSLGLWSSEGKLADFNKIGDSFNELFKTDSEKKLGVLHFFQPFAVDGINTQNFYPSVERINNIIEKGYIPMITLEDHFVNANPSMKQPNLYSIIEGHFDPFFKQWATQIKEVKGTILLRILHEFNGNWYPWCIVNNDKDPTVLVKAFRHIHDIFKSQGVTNVKFIWCPNSMSVPQEKWNYIMEAYPGDDYVDFVGLDIYNGAGNESNTWRSFRKEGIENYFLLTHYLPNKPLFICETASREREKTETGSCQNKAEWIEQMSFTLKSDMSQIRLLTWFNESGSFKITSSPAAKKSFAKFIMQDFHFKSGTKHLSSLIR